MLDLMQELEQVDAIEIEDILKAVLRRCAVLFPAWEVSVLSLRKSEDKNEQIDRTIEMLQNMKTNY